LDTELQTHRQLLVYHDRMIADSAYGPGGDVK